MAKGWLIVAGVWASVFWALFARSIMGFQSATGSPVYVIGTAIELAAYGGLGLTGVLVCLLAGRKRA
jgi:hypothetical protein